MKPFLRNCIALAQHSYSPYLPCLSEFYYLHTVSHRWGSLTASFYRHRITDSLYIAVAGTDDMLDWVRNARVLRMRWGGTWVHRGFAHAAKTLLADVQREVRSEAVITGHSAGGAIALCLAAEVPATVVTFGQPRVALGDGPTDWAKRYIRVQNASDAVCQLPPVALGYVHAHSEHIYLPGDLAERHWTNPSYWQMLRDRLRRNVRYRTHDHRAFEYRRAIEEQFHEQDTDVEAAQSRGVTGGV